MATAADETHASLTASEQALMKIWTDVLRVPNPDKSADFFDIGGDSLTAMEVIGRVREELQVELPLLAFFEDPTITHLAAVVDELSATTEATAPILRNADRSEFPVSYSQQVFWLLEQQNPGTGRYNTARIFRIRGEVDPAVLERAINELCRRNEILRVRFVHTANGLFQLVQAASSIPLPVTDLSALREDAREQTAVNLALETVREPFDLSSGAVLRARLIPISPDESLLCMALHHAITDGFTGSLLLDEIGAIYDAFADGQPVPLPEPDLHFTDYAAWEREWMQGSRLERELDYWRSALHGTPSLLALPADFAPPSEPDHRGRLVPLTIPRELFLRVQDLAHAGGMTLFTVLTAAARILLYRWSGQADFLLGTISSNRSRGGTERMMGCFVNPLPLRNPVVEGQSVQDLLLAESKALMDAFAHQDCPFAAIVEAINPERSGADNPLFNVALLLQNFPAIEFNGSHFRAEGVNLDAHGALLDLRFLAVETGGSLQVSCEYKTSLLANETAVALLEAYAAVLEAITGDPSRPVASIELPQVLVRQVAASRRRGRTRAVAVASSFTAQPLGEPLTSLLSELDMDYRLVFAPDRQVLQQLRDPRSTLRAADGFAIVLTRFEDWLPGGVSANGALHEKLEQAAAEFASAIQTAAGAPLIVCFCPASRAIVERLMVERLQGKDWLDSLEARIALPFADSPSVHVIRSAEILDLYSAGEYEDEYARRLANVPYTTAFFSAVGTILVRRMWGLAENRYTTLVIEGGGILWQGGSEKNEPLQIDDPRRLLLDVLLHVRKHGLVLCLCGEGPEADLWAAFDNNPSMPLKRADFAAALFGPEPGSAKLAGLSRQTGIELDRCIFLSADPSACAAVEASLPEVLALEMPEQHAEIPDWLRHIWAFDRFNEKKETRGL